MSIREASFTDVDVAIAALDPATAVTLQMDEDAFRGFYDRTSRMLWVYLQRMTGDRSVADDLLQESYYRFLRADATLDNEAHRRHYLFRIATNLARDRFRRAKHVPVHVPHDDDLGPAVARREHEDTQANRRMDVDRAMSQMPPRERSMLWLAYAQGASHEEIAEVVGVGRASVKTLLFRARRRLASLLSPNGASS